MREGVILLNDDTEIGKITSDGFGPSLNAPIAMGYIPPALAAIGTLLHGDLRGKPSPLRLAAMPFYPTDYKR